MFISYLWKLIKNNQSKIILISGIMSFFLKKINK